MKDLKRCKLAPTVYSYTNLINACVRCGDVTRVREVLEEMRADGVDANEARMHTFSTI